MLINKPYGGIGVLVNPPHAVRPESAKLLPIKLFRHWNFGNGLQSPTVTLPKHGFFYVDTISKRAPDSVHSPDFGDCWTSSIVTGLTQLCLSELTAGRLLSSWISNTVILPACHSWRAARRTWIKPASFWDILIKHPQQRFSSGTLQQHLCPDNASLLGEMSNFYINTAL